MRCKCFDVIPDCVLASMQEEDEESAGHVTFAARKLIESELGVT